MVSSHLFAGPALDLLPRGMYCRLWMGFPLLSIHLTRSLHFCLCLPVYCNTDFVSSSFIIFSYPKNIKKKNCRLNSLLFCSVRVHIGLLLKNFLNVVLIWHLTFLKIFCSMCLINWCLCNFGAVFVSVFKIGVIIALSHSLCVSLDVYMLLWKFSNVCMKSDSYFYNSELISSSGDFLFWRFFCNFFQFPQVIFTFIILVSCHWF